MTEAASTRRLRAGSVGGVVAVAAYAILGSILAWSRLWGLDSSFWHDEIFFVAEFVREGPGEILAGAELSHELFGVLAWATSSLAGESEVALRLWSTIPFLLGVALVTSWLHRRLGVLSGLLFLFLATVSPLLLDITRQARGYGLAFLAMCVLCVAALETDRSGRTWTVVAFCGAGIVGAWTLPQFGIAFLATGAVLLADRLLRRRLALGLGASTLAIGAWYAPHLHEVRESSRIEDGVQIDTLWLITAPIDQLLIPALLWIDGSVLIAGVVWIPVIAAAVLLMGSSPLVREPRTALILGSGVATVFVLLWIGRAYVVPRYLSFLLVPLLILTATGSASILARLTTRPAILRTLVVLVVVGGLAARFAGTAPDVVRLPREAHRDAAETIERQGPDSNAVLAYMHNPGDLAFYLERPVRELETSMVARAVCAGRLPVVYVMQPFVVPPVSVPCLSRAGVEQHRFEQYTRGDHIDVWFIPAMG